MRLLSIETRVAELPYAYSVERPVLIDSLHAVRTGRVPRALPRPHFKADFEARSSEKLAGKVGDNKKARRHTEVG